MMPLIFENEVKVKKLCVSGDFCFWVLAKTHTEKISLRISERKKIWCMISPLCHKVLFLLLKFLTACELGRLSKISIFIINSGPMTNTSPNRSPWTTLNKPTLSSCRALVIICLDHAPGSKEWTFIDSGALMNRDFDTVPFRKKTQLINNEKIHGKVARVWC